MTTSEARSSAAPYQQPPGTFEFRPDGGIGTGGEIVAERTEFSQTFATDIPGVFRTVQSPTPIHFQDESGAWQPVDTELTTTGDGLTTEATGPQVDIASAATESSLASIETPDGGSVAFGLADATPVLATVDGATASFEGIAPDTTLEITALASGVKEAIVLDTPGSPTHFEFPLQLDGVVPGLEADGSVTYRNGEGDIVARTPAGFMTDSTDGRGEGARSDGVVYGLAETDQGWTLAVDLDAAWLSDPARVYPVVVDPTTYTEPLSTLSPDLDDTYVVQGAAATDRSSESVLKIGYDGSTVHRAFLHFSELDQFEGMNIFQARLDLTQSGASTCSATAPFVAYRIRDGWTAGSATSYPGPGSDLTDGSRLSSATTSVGFGGTGSCAASGTASIMLTPAAWNWTDSTWSNNGILLKAADETSTAGYRRFASADDPAHPPRLELIWSDPTAGGSDAPVIPIEQAPAGRLPTATPTLSGEYVDPQNENGHVAFFVYNSENYYWGWTTGSVVASGNASTLSIPATAALPTDAPLVVRAVAVEGSPGSGGAPSPSSVMAPTVGIEVPSAVLTSPSDGAIVTGNVTLTASAPAALGGTNLDAVEFLRDGEVVATDTSSPYTVSGPSTSIPNGDYFVEARALYGGGARVVTAAGALITVDNSPCPADDSYEDNDTRSNATGAQLSLTAVSCASDADWYSVQLDAGEEIQLGLSALDQTVNLDLGFYSATASLASSTSSAAIESIAHQVGTAGTYYVKVFGASSSDEGHYTLTTGSSATESASEAATFPNKIGVNSIAVWGSEDEAYNEFLPLAQAGVTQVRDQIPWREVQPNGPGDWDPSRLDNLFGGAARAGVSVVGILGQPPRWASACGTSRGYDWSCANPDGSNKEYWDWSIPNAFKDEFATFARRLVERYGQNGTFWPGFEATHENVARRPVRAFEILNEPWFSRFWGGRCPNPRRYARLVEAVGTEILDVTRGQNPPTRVLISGDLYQNWDWPHDEPNDGITPRVSTPLSCPGETPTDWIAKVLGIDGDLGDAFNRYSVHPYTAYGDVGPYARTSAEEDYDFGKLRPIYADILANQRSGPPHEMWITETGWSTANQSGTEQGHNRWVTEPRQADFVRNAVLRSLGTPASGVREFPYVERTYIFTWSRDGIDPTDREAFFGLRRNNGSSKPAFPMLCRLARTNCPL